MRIALTGASGFIGSRIARLLAGRGHAVTALVREASRRDHIEDCVDRFVVGEQDDREAWAGLLDGADAVVHNSVDWRAIRDGDRARHLRSNLLGSVELLRVSAPRAFVFISTIAVHHDMSARWNGRPDEEHPLRPAGDYGAYKAAVEAHLWSEHYGSEGGEGGRLTVALRPCGVYGVDPALDRSHGYKFVKDIAAGRAITRKGGGKFVHVDDVALAVLAALTSDGAERVAARPFNLVDCYARWSDIADMAGELMGRDVDVDRGSPGEAKNVFERGESEALVAGSSSIRGDERARFLSRGHAGLREHLGELIAAMRASGELD